MGEGDQDCIGEDSGAVTAGFGPDANDQPAQHHERPSQTTPTQPELGDGDRALWWTVLADVQRTLVGAPDRDAWPRR
jgi:hypothetical protein